MNGGTKDGSGKMLWVMTALSFLLIGAASEASPTSEAVEFFEARIRPILAQDCYECHSSAGKAKGGLVLDHREGLLAGGDSGPALVPGNPEGSLLMRAMRHEDEDLAMPKAGAKLEGEILADFERWIEMGAPDPRDGPPSMAEVEADRAWPAILERRKQWWSFQAVADVEVPDSEGWSEHEVDRFLEAAMRDRGLEPGSEADRRVLIRRLSFALRGLPPSAEEIDRFLGDESGDAWDRVVDEMLDSPRFGERWARHWMDWMRYAESHGSEGDTRVPHAWRYRDYLIRALNEDVPYNQLVREHLAGDLLSEPRVNAALGLNESAIGPAHLRMVFHGFDPTDALAELVRFTDDQINVVSKAFQGMTVSCARCHDHKFDPISDEDYYAWFGIFSSTRPGQVVVDDGATQERNLTELRRLKERIRDVIAEAWLDRIGEMDVPFFDEVMGGDEVQMRRDAEHPMRPWGQMRGLGGAKTPEDLWTELRGGREDVEVAGDGGWRLEGGDEHGWLAKGLSLGKAVSQPGEFRVLPEGDRVFEGLYPAGLYSHLVSEKHAGVVGSPRFTIKHEKVSVRLLGGGRAFARLVVQNYPIQGGNVYRMFSEPDSDEMGWVTWDVSYWQGDEAFVEVVTRDDRMGARGQRGIAPETNGRSYFGVAEVILHDEGALLPGDRGRATAALLLGAIPESVEALAEAYREALAEAVRRWKSEEAREDDVALLDWFVRGGFLPTSMDAVPEAAELVARYRSLEEEIAFPRRSPGVFDHLGEDSPVFVRGDPKEHGELVSRRFLEVFDDRPYETELSGRLEFAEDLLREDNPLTARIAVNRIWHYLFGRGLCATVDNFGRMGEKPSHPELLDFLATRFVERGWSIKELIRYLTTSRAYRMSAVSSERAEEIDPDNVWLSHFTVRRLEGEAIRDTLQSVSGRLDLTMYGSGVGESSGRRSVYLSLRRNSLNPFLEVFDAPAPGGPKGRRDVTTVPAQSLVMLNDPFVLECARDWAKGLAADPRPFEEVLGTMFEAALGREPTPGEVAAAHLYLDGVSGVRAGHREELVRLRVEIAGREAALRGIVEPVRERLLLERSEEDTSLQEVSGPLPLARWSFEEGFKDGLGELHGTAHGSATIEGGALVLDGAGAFVSTSTIHGELKAKTLEAWVELDGLNQAGGGVMTVQNVDGKVFDAIVFGEGNPRCWVPGSNNHQRTRKLDGPMEEAAVREAVHIAMVYSEDGRVTAYRNGRRYGESYKSRGPATFAAGKSQVLFGNRHGVTAGGNRLLAGRIFEARLYDRALSAEEIEASWRSLGTVLSDREIIAALGENEVMEKAVLEVEIAALREELKEAEVLAKPGDDELQAWQDLAHTIFNFKEFIYIQ
ncbi:MAG: DUF1553 domain-containing protein [Verrucomicrobiota bacterium]